MIRKIVTVLILVPLALAIVMFAVANRAPVALGFDPFGTSRRCSPSSAPLFLALLAALLAGVVVGGAAAWSRQGKWRRRARRLSAELKAARGEIETLRRRLEASARGAAADIRSRRSRTAIPRHRLVCVSSAPKSRSRPDLSGAGRGAARGVPRRRHGAAAPSPPDPAARRRGDGPADAGVDQRAGSFLGCKIVTVFPDNARCSGRRSTAATC